MLQVTTYRYVWLLQWDTAICFLLDAQMVAEIGHQVVADFRHSGGKLRR